MPFANQKSTDPTAVPLAFSPVIVSLNQSFGPNAFSTQSPFSIDATAQVVFVTIADWTFMPSGIVMVASTPASIWYCVFRAFSALEQP